MWVWHRHFVWQIKALFIKDIFSKKSLNEYANSIGVSLPQTCMYTEMIERLTVHLEKKERI